MCVEDYLPHFKKPKIFDFRCCAKSFLDLDTSWLLTNQNYQITFRINELGTRRIIAEKLSFKIVDKLYPQDY